MKKGMKRVFAASLIGIMAFSLAACGSSSGDTSEETEAAADETGAEASGEEVVLEFPCIWVGTDSKAEVFGQMVEDFNEEYDGKYQVNISEYTDYDAYADYIRTTISTGDAPDLFSVKTMADVELYSESGKIMDLTDFLSSDEMASKYPEGEVTDGQVDGKNYAMPWEAAIIPVIYNGTLLENAGITDLPTDMDGFLDTLQALKDSGVDTPVSFMTANNAWTAMLWYTYALAAEGNGNVFESDEWDTDTFVAAAEDLQKIYEYAPSDAIGADAQVVNSHFFNNETAVYTNGTWILSNIQENAADGVYDNLKFSAGPNNSIIQYTQAYIMSGCVDDPDKQEAVEAFLSWITDEDRLTELSNSSGAVFCVKTGEVDNDYINQIVEIRDNADIVIPSFESSVSTTAANDLSPQLESFLAGDITAEEFVENLQADNAE